jgi:hypothetical protein
MGDSRSESVLILLARMGRQGFQHGTSLRGGQHNTVSGSGNMEFGSAIFKGPDEQYSSYSGSHLNFLLYTSGGNSPSPSRGKKVKTPFLVQPSQTSQNRYEESSHRRCALILRAIHNLTI